VEAAGGAFRAEDRYVHVDLGPDARVDLELEHPVSWPRPLGAGGIFSALPFLGQYWQPHVLGGRVSGDAAVVF
jgi:hypothetical protein